MHTGRERAEWNRLSCFMAFVANRLRFTDNAPITHPRDLNPFAEEYEQARPKTMKDRMNEFFARNPNMPVQTMKFVDGKWIGA